MFLPSSSQQLQRLKNQAFQKGNTNSCSSSHLSSSLLFDNKPTDSGQLDIFLLETVRQHGEKKPAVCLEEEEEEVVVCISYPAPGFLKVLQLALHPVSSNGPGDGAID